jgi:hypothetical protein
MPGWSYQRKSLTATDYEIEFTENRRIWTRRIGELDVSEPKYWNMLILNLETTGDCSRRLCSRIQAGAVVGFCSLLGVLLRLNNASGTWANASANASLLLVFGVFFCLKIRNDNSRLIVDC